MLHPQTIYDKIIESLKVQYPNADISITDKYTSELFAPSEWRDQEGESQLVKPHKLLILDDQVLSFIYPYSSKVIGLTVLRCVFWTLISSLSFAEQLITQTQGDIAQMQICFLHHKMFLVATFCCKAWMV